MQADFILHEICGAVIYHTIKINKTLQKLWPPKISCATGNRLGIPGSLNTKSVAVTKAVKYDEKSA
jgi:hypothetical protein